MRIIDHDCRINESDHRQAENLLCDIRGLHTVLGYEELEEKGRKLFTMSTCHKHNDTETIEHMVGTMLEQLGRKVARPTRSTAWLGKA